MTNIKYCFNVGTCENNEKQTTINYTNQILTMYVHQKHLLPLNVTSCYKQFKFFNYYNLLFHCNFIYYYIFFLLLLF